MGVLRIYLLGVVRITHDRYPEEIKIRGTARRLLAYLVLFRDRLHSREVLAGIFWGDSSEDRARSSLGTAIWRLRKALEPGGIPKGTYLRTTPMGEVGFNPKSNHWLDVAKLENQAEEVLAKPCHSLAAGEIGELEKARELYTGDLLEGFYDDWALGERERVRTLYLKSQAHLLGHYRHKGAHDKALACGGRILKLDPLREEIHREMIRLYMESGQRVNAVRQYETCCKILDTELGVPPMEETRALCAQIVETAQRPARSHSQGNLTNTRQVLQQLNKTLQDFDKAAGQLRRTGKLLEELLEN